MIKFPKVDSGIYLLELLIAISLFDTSLSKTNGPDGLLILVLPHPELWVPQGMIPPFSLPDQLKDIVHASQDMCFQTDKGAMEVDSLAKSLRF